MESKALPVITEHTYCNPLPVEYKETGLSRIEAYSNADPYVLKYCGGYYCYSTGIDGVHVLYSKDLTEFKHLGYALQARDEEEYWAPCVFYDNGFFYMYYSSNPKGETDDHYHTLRLAVSDKPQGPFIFKKCFTDVFAIDPHLIRNADGQLYMFYSINTFTGVDASCAGTGIVVDKMSDFYTLDGSPRPVILPSHDHEIFQRNRFGDGRDWYTVEGAFYLEGHGNAYVMYSGNAFLSPNYFVGYSKAEISGSIDSFKWTKQTAAGSFPLIGKSEAVMGTGHNSVVKAPNNVDDWIIYHGRATDIKSDDPWHEVRIMRMDPLLWGEDCLLTSAPTHTDQDAPARPAFMADFKDEFHDHKILGGEWVLESGCAKQTAHNTFSRLHINDLRLQNHITEAWLKWERYHMGGRCGVISAADDNSCIMAELHVGRRSVQLYAVNNGVAGPVSSAVLPENFCFDSWHKLSVQRTGSHFAVLVDDMPMVSGDFSANSGSVGIFGAYTAFSCSSLEVTEYLELNEKNSASFAQQLTTENSGSVPQWMVEKNTLNALGSSSGGCFCSVPENYRFSANMSITEGVRGKGAGFYAQYIDDKNYLLVLVSPDKQELSVIETKDSNQKIHAACKYSELIASIFVKKYRDKIYILINGKEIYAGKSIKSSACGFYAVQPVKYSAIELLGL